MLMLNCRIPQGSNDLPSCNLFSSLRMYADDTTLSQSMVSRVPKDFKVQ